MRATPRLCLLIAALGASAAAPASANDADTVLAQLKAAANGVTSVVIDTSATAPIPMTMTMTFVQPMSMKSVFTVGTSRVETYLVDGMIYVHIVSSDSWRKVAFDPANPPPQVFGFIKAAKAEKITILPDAVENGELVGELQLEMPLPAAAGTAAVGPPVQLTCSYDKTTFHFVACANHTLTLTFSKYNDPSNAVVLPPASADAVLIKTRTPAPAGMATPLPSASATPPVPAEPAIPAAPAAPATPAAPAATATPAAPIATSTPA